MRYMLLIYGDPAAEAPSEQPDGVFEDWVKATEALAADGALVAGDGLEPVGSATTVRHRDGERLRTDGPFAETKEHLLGYYLVDVADREQALDYAERLPNVTYGTIEVRPVMGSAASDEAVQANSATAG